SAQISNPGNAPVSFEWSFQDGTTTTTSVPQTEHTYAPGSITTGMTTVTLKSPHCRDQSLSVTVTQNCQCPTIGTPGGALTGSGCAPGAGVTLSTSITPPTASSFDWTVTTPGGTSFTKTTTAASTTDTSADGAWTNTSTGPTGAVDLSMAGAYAVTVRPRGSAISPSCPSPAPGSFPIPACSAPPPGGGASSCPWWCWLLGILFISIPISAYISSVATCDLPWWGAIIASAVIAGSIVIFSLVCSV